MYDDTIKLLEEDIGETLTYILAVFSQISLKAKEIKAKANGA